MNKERNQPRTVEFEVIIGLNLAEGDIRLLDYSHHEFSTRLDICGKVKYTKEKIYHKFEIDANGGYYVFELIIENSIKQLIENQLYLLKDKGVLENGS